MKGNEKSKLVRGVRFESHRFRIISIVIGCFLICMTFMVSSRPEALAFKTPSLNPSPESSHRITTTKENIDFRDVGVDLEPHFTQQSKDIESEKEKEESKPARDTTNIQEVDLKPNLDQRREGFESQNAGAKHMTIKETINFGDVGENNEQNPDETISLGTTLVEGVKEKTQNEKKTINPNERTDREELEENKNEDCDSSESCQHDKSKQVKLATVSNSNLTNEEPIQVKPRDLEKSDNPTTDNSGRKLVCDFTDHRSDTCKMSGDVRIHGNSSSIFFFRPKGSKKEKIYKIKPYARKGDQLCQSHVTEISVRSTKSVPKCTVNHTVPAVVFSIGGYTGNVFHDFSDVIMPLFTASRPFNGQVQLLITDLAPWWLIKYDKLLKALSNYPPIDFGKDDQVHCFKHAIIGVQAHKELIIEPSRNPNNYSTRDFTRFIREAFSLERDAATVLGELMTKKPRLFIISRARTRLITNLQDLTRVGEELGFEIVVQEADVGNDIVEYARVINSCDVMVGVHGAGLTNEMFLPPNATLIQIVPWGGLEWIAQMDYGQPAIEMGLNYIQYSISIEESSLIEKYPRDHEIFKNPIALHKNGFGFMKKVLMDGQNISIDTKKFKNLLIAALDKLSH